MFLLVFQEEFLTIFMIVIDLILFIFVQSYLL